MRKLPLYLLAASLVFGSALAIGFRVIRTTPGWDSGKKQYTLPNGWRVTPVGEAVPLPGDMPVTILPLADGKRALVNTCGFHDHSISLVDVDQAAVLSTQPYPTEWIGLGLASDGHVYASGGKSDEAVHQLSLSGNVLTKEQGWKIANQDHKDQFLSSLIVDGETILALNIQTDEVLRLKLGGEVVTRSKVGYRPYGLALSPDGQTLAVSNWGDQTVSLLNPQTLEKRTTVKVGSHPNALLYDATGRLFVANAGSNTISVLLGGVVAETIRTSPIPGGRLGATPLSLAIDETHKRLYVAEAGANCVGVVDVAEKGDSRVLGFIPTSRYPSAVAVTPDGSKVLVATGKGLYGPNAGSKVDLTGDKVRGADLGNRFNYVADQLAGVLAVIPTPDAKTLKTYTQEVLANQPLGLVMAPAKPVRDDIQKNAFDHIKHVIYIIKENRTYDQILGYVAKGNGDSSLTLFPEPVTPNIHKIVNTFSLLDNLYTDGEVSQCGHQWTDAAYANDYTEKQWILSYSGRDEVESDTRLTSSPGDYLWTLARKHGRTARVFGEYVNLQEDHDSLRDPVVKKDPEKYGFSAKFEEIFARGGRDVEKADEFIAELHEAESSGIWPNLMVMALPEDHTRGLSAGKFSPRAMVADNDQAVGKVVEAVSHSRFWPETAIFVIEDDAQDGPDHVDSHRTTGLVISPYVKRGIVDSTMYSTSSMLRTMELILGLPPMTDYDALATPMYASFTVKPDLSPYDLVPAQWNLKEKNPAGTSLAIRSSKLDFSDIDRADPQELNHILWEALRPGQAYPGSVTGYGTATADKD